MKIAMIVACLLLTACNHERPRQLASEHMLQQRCAELNVTCEVQWVSLGETTHQWRADAHNSKYPLNSDWWFAYEPTREEAIDRLYVYLGGCPTNPGDPLPEVLYHAKEPR